MEKNLYEILEFLEAAKEIKQDKNYWQAVAYLYYCNNNILKNKDENFTQRLTNLIEDNSQKECPTCKKIEDYMFYENFYYYAVNPEPSEKRKFHSEFFPTLLRKTLNF